MQHKRVPQPSCVLYHSNCLSDRINHFCQEYKPILQSCKQIFIERQPITGHISVKQLIFKVYRKKALLVHPTSMHKYFKIDYLSYEEKKAETIKLCQKYITNDCKKHFLASKERKHDITDTICILLYQLYKNRVNYKIKKRIDRSKIQFKL